MTVDLWTPYICSCSFWWAWPWCKVTVGRQRQNFSVELFLTTKDAASIKLATTVGLFLFLHDLDFANIYMAWPSWFFGMAGGVGGCSSRKYFWIVLFISVDAHQTFFELCSSSSIQWMFMGKIFNCPFLLLRRSSRFCCPAQSLGWMQPLPEDPPSEP